MNDVREGQAGPRARSYGRINMYTCQCGWFVITKDIEEGVTPFMIGCRKCGEFAESSMYSVSQGLPWAAEWRKEMDPESKAVGHPVSFEHQSKGGLFLHYLEEARSDWVPPSEPQTTFAKVGGKSMRVQVIP